MTQPFNVNDKVYLNDMQGRQNVPCVIVRQQSDNQPWIIEFEGTNEYGLTGQQEVFFTTDLSPRND